MVLAIWMESFQRIHFPIHLKVSDDFKYGFSNLDGRHVMLFLFTLDFMIFSICFIFLFLFWMKLHVDIALSLHVIQV
ncbi:hypothetical protein HanIR_Chr06g0290221 [Helianthus annuus]|nr:hypothetical protein HanIR_Chr06g0290221 [Helianthus annuus]